MKNTNKVITMALVTAFSYNVNAQDIKKEEVFKPTIKMEGRIMYDFNFLEAGDDYKFGGSKFRRLRIAAKGKLSKAISYSADFDFTAGKIAYRNVNIIYKMPKNYGKFTFGSFDEPTGLDMLTSSKYMTFIERAMMTTTQFGKYSTGFRYANQKILNGKIGLQLAYTFNGKGSLAYQDNDLYGGNNILGRITGKVYENKEKKQLIHIGFNYENRNDDKNDFKYKSFTTENSMGKKITIASAGKLKNTSDIGFELAAVIGSFSVQGEFESATINTDLNTFKSNGYYGYISYFITGENRTYKNSIFGRVKPKKNFLKDGGFGAIELVGRYSVMNLNSNKDPNDIDNKKYEIANITLGFNWYLNPHTRLMYNYINGNHYDLAPTIYNGKNLIGHLIRFQVDF